MKVLIWGTGKYYQANKNVFRKNVDVVGFIDNNSKKQGEFLDGRRIYSPCEIEQIKYDCIFILCKDYVSVRKQLMNMKLPVNIVVYDVMQIEMLCELPKAIYYNYSDNKPHTRKILAFSLSLSSTGAQNVMFMFFQILLKQSYEITVVSKGDGPLRERLKDLGVSVIITPDFRHNNPELSDFIEAADLIVVNTIWLAYVVDGLANYNKKIMWWLHESAMLSYIDISCIQRNMNAENVEIFAVSRIVKEYLETSCKMQDKIGLFPFGIPEYDESKKSKMVFAIIGGMGYIKGQDIFVDAVERVPVHLRKNAEFWIVGGGTLENSILEKALSIPEIIIKGEVDNRYMKFVYEAIDVVVCCSREEAMSIAVMEGLMNKKLGIVSDRAGISEFMHDGIDGFIVPNEDIEGFASKMIWALEHPNEVKVIGARARDIYDNHFSFSAFENRVNDLMKKII